MIYLTIGLGLREQNIYLIHWHTISICNCLVSYFTDISSNYLGAEGAISLARMIILNTTLTDVSYLIIDQLKLKQYT